MQDFDGRTAVITGGASGIGLAVAQRLAAAGMQLVLADIEQPVLDEQVARLTAAGHAVIGVVTDVADADAVHALATTAADRFGPVHVLFNNAGVGVGGPIAAPDDLEMWQWGLGVNLWGVIHGVKAFVPAMLDHGEPCHVVNTASMAGLLPTPGLGAYTVSKYGVVAVSETLALETQGTAMGVSVLCPGFVQTNLGDSDRNLPEHLVDPLDEPSAEEEILRQMMHDLIDGGIPAADVAERVFEGIVEARFAILPHPHYGEQIVARARALVAGHHPASWDI